MNEILNYFQTINNATTADTRVNQDRVELYSRHVRCLYFKDCRETIRWHIIHRLSTLEKPLFPNLESVNIPLAQYQPHHVSSPVKNTSAYSEVILITENSKQLDMQLYRQKSTLPETYFKRISQIQIYSTESRLNLTE